MAKLFAYNNTGTLIPGTIQVGNISIAVSDVNFIESGLDWYMGADESIGYVICGEHPIQKIQFWRSKNMSDTSLLDLLNRNFHQTFDNVNDARIWLINNGFYNTYPNIITDGLILNLDASNGDSFKGESGTTVATGGGWKDLSGNNNDGEISGVTYNSDLSGSLVFNGVNNYVLVNTTNQITTSDISVFVWVKVSSSFPSGSSVGIIFGNHAISPTLSFEGHTSGRIRIYWNGGQLDFYSTNFDIRDDKWHHVGFTRKYSDNSLIIYIDGVINNFTTAGSNITLSFPFKIGDDFRNNTSPGVPFNGNISNIMVWNRSLSIQEVFIEYENNRHRYSTSNTPNQIISNNNFISINGFDNLIYR